MKVIPLPLLLFAATILLLSTTTALEPRVTQANPFDTNAFGFSSSSQDSTDLTTVSGNGVTTSSSPAVGSSTDTPSATTENDYLSTKGKTILERDHSAPPNQHQSLLNNRITSTQLLESAKVAAKDSHTALGEAPLLGLWSGLIAILGVITKQQTERSPTSPPTFKKSKPRLTTDTVSFRIDSSLRANLDDEAKKNRTSLNTLVSQILFRYADWGRYAGKLGLIPVSKDLLRDVFKSLDKQELEDLGKRFAETSGREHVLYLFQQVSLGTILQFLDLWSSHFDAYEHRYDGKMHFYTVHHDVNLNFSIFVKEYVSTMIMGTVPRTVRFETVAPNSVTFSFEG